MHVNKYVLFYIISILDKSIKKNMRTLTHHSGVKNTYSGLKYNQAQ